MALAGQKGKLVPAAHNHGAGTVYSTAITGGRSQRGQWCTVKEIPAVPRVLAWETSA